MFSWFCCKQNISKRQILENILPEQYHYRIINFKVVEESQIVNQTKFEAIVSVNICSEEHIKEFINDFQKSSSTNYNIQDGDKNVGKNTLRTGHRKCHHNAYQTKKG